MEEALSGITDDLRYNKDSALSFSRTLSEIHHSILETQNTVRSQPDIFRNIMHSRSSYDRQLQLQPIPQQTPLPWLPSRGSLEPLIHTFSSLRPLSIDSPGKSLALVADKHQEEVTEQDVTDQDFPLSHGSFRACNSTSTFESSPTFFPEIYTTNPRLPASSIIVTCSNELSSSTQYRTNYYRILYLKSPRQWSRMNIATQIPSSSRYWTATRLSQHEHTSSGFFVIGFECSLPQSLLK